MISTINVSLSHVVVPYRVTYGNFGTPTRADYSATVHRLLYVFEYLEARFPEGNCDYILINYLTLMLENVGWYFLYSSNEPLPSTWKLG